MLFQIRNMFPIFVLLVAWQPLVNGFAEWMTKDFCDRPLGICFQYSSLAFFQMETIFFQTEKGEVIMNSFVAESTDRFITVYRGGKELKSGDTFTPGEMLHVHVSDGTPQYVLEIRNGYFPGGGCHGRRISDKNDVDAMMPLDDEVHILQRILLFFVCFSFSFSS